MRKFHLLQEELAPRALFLLVVLRLRETGLARWRWLHLGARLMVVLVQRLHYFNFGWLIHAIKSASPLADPSLLLTAFIHSS